MDAYIANQLHASVDALKIAEVLSARGVPADRAHRLGELALMMADPVMYDAALWRAAEALCALLEARADTDALRHFPARVRQLHLVSAVHAIRGFEMVLTGALNPEQVAQCYADYQRHREQVTAATLAKRLEFAKAGDQR